MLTSKTPDFVTRRGELLAELFLNELGAKVSKPHSDAIDFLALFESAGKAVHLVAVNIKATENPVPASFEADAASVEFAASSNIPLLLLVIDVKRNKIGFAWLDEFARNHEPVRRKAKEHVVLGDAEKNRDKIRERVMTMVTSHT